MRALLLLSALTLPLAACSEGVVPGDDDDSTPEEEEPTPEPIPDPLFDEASGTTFYELTYTEGPLAGQSCTEEWSMTSVDVTTQVPQRLQQLQETCANCDTLFQAYFTAVDDPCAGSADIPDDNFIAFDTVSEEGYATFYWFVNGEWYDLGAGELDYDEVEIVIEDPDERGWGGFGGNSTQEDPCGFFNRCRWDGRYLNFFDLGSLPHPDELDEGEE